MATKKSDTKVTKITASDGSKMVKATKKPVLDKKSEKAGRTKRSYGPIGAFGRYIKGAWTELRQVHWPTRRATWSLTGAVLVFSLFFVVFITMLDAAFKFLFEQILK